MTVTRSAVREWFLANPIYRNALVYFYTVSDGERTNTLATMYQNRTGADVAANPQRCNSDGRFRQPVYHDAEVIAVVEGVNIPSHETGIIQLNGQDGEDGEDGTNGEDGEVVVTDSNILQWCCFPLCGENETLTSVHTITFPMPAGTILDSFISCNGQSTADEIEIDCFHYDDNVLGNSIFTDPPTIAINSDHGENGVLDPTEVELPALSKLRATVVSEGTDATGVCIALRVQFADGGGGGGALVVEDTGTIKLFAGGTLPGGWLLCNGAAISRVMYSDLFTAIGTTFGAGNGTTTFNLPNFASRMPLGTGTGAGLTARTMGQTGGAESVTLSAAQSGIPAHTHTASLTGGGGEHGHTIDVYRLDDYEGEGGDPAFVLGSQAEGKVLIGSVDTDETEAVTGVTVDASAGAAASSSHSIMNPYLVCSFIIKT